jgi:hypothetical protein
MACPSPKLRNSSSGSRRLRPELADGLIVMGRVTFSLMVRQGSSAGACGTRPTALSRVASRTDLPLMLTRPLSAPESPAMTLSSVDLPQPLGPMTETNSPLADGQADAVENGGAPLIDPVALGNGLDMDTKASVSSCVAK